MIAFRCGCSSVRAVDRAVIAKACEVEESWFDGWSGSPIGIYPVPGSDGQIWVIDIGVRRKTVTSQQAARVRYALGRLCVPYVGCRP